MPSSCRRSRRARCRSARRRNPPRSPRSGGCCTSGSPARGATSGCRGRRRGSGRPVARAGGAAHASSTDSCRRGRPRAGRSWRAGRDAAAGRAAQGRPGRSLAAVQRAPCLAHGPCQGRRRRPVHRLPRLDRSRPSPSAGRARSPTCGASRRRPDEARPLRRRDHRSRRPRRPPGRPYLGPTSCRMNAT